MSWHSTLKVQNKTEKDETSNYSSPGEGIHEAIDDIMTAMKTMISDLS
jgi:hypothetical protein